MQTLAKTESHSCLILWVHRKQKRKKQIMYLNSTPPPQKKEKKKRRRKNLEAPQTSFCEKIFSELQPRKTHFNMHFCFN